jgi:CheY-like chemotaxis protein
VKLHLPLRILLLDDEVEIHDTAVLSRQSLDFEVDLFTAQSVVQAADLFRRHFFDLVLIDLVGLDGSLVGLELLRFLRQLKASPDVVVMTHLDLQLNQGNAMNAMATIDQPRVVRFIDKRHSSDFLHDAVEYTIDRLLAPRCRVENVDLIAQLIDTRKGRYRRQDALGLRESVDEIGLEIERLSAELFGALPMGSLRQTSITVRFEPLERLGLSASVVARALVWLGLNDLQKPEPYECVVKIGPREELREEASRYLEVVRFGVRLEERVELLGTASGDSLGAIVYSMAGGTRGSVHSLDELIADRPIQARDVIDRLFSNSNWYGVDAGLNPPREFFRKARRTDFVSAFDTSLPAIEKACAVAGALVDKTQDDPLVSVPGGLRFSIPGREFTGTGPMLRPRPWCLVHGDMHGGNIMVELGPNGDSEEIRRVCLIDYRQAGPGPRCVDAAAIECAIRLADAHDLEIEGSQAGDPKEAARKALLRFKDERALLDRLWHPDSDLARKFPFSRSGPWLMLAEAVVAGVRKVFSEHRKERVPVSDREYVETCLLYGLGQLRYPLDETVRLRLLAWVGALYAYVGEGYEETTRHPRSGNGT